MRIGLNLLYLIPGVVGGTETYAASLIDALGALPERHDYVLFTNREAAERFPGLPDNFRQVVCGVHATRRAARYAYEQGLLPAQVARAGIDVLHSLGYVGPLRVGARHVVSVPDLNFIGHAEAMPAGKRRILGRFVRWSAQRADHVITISEFSRGQIANFLGPGSAERITVTHLAGRPRPADDGLGTEAVRARYGIRGPYIIAFASSSPHKNISRLVEAFRAIADDVPHTLVLVGHLPARADRGGHAAAAERVITTGYVPDSDVLPLLRGADLFAFPSLYEGFGLPLLDAQASGVPVVCSTAGSLPEIAGDGAICFDPRRVDEIAGSMRRVLADPVLAHTLRARGSANERRFSWAHTAAQTLAVYRQIAPGSALPRAASGEFRSSPTHA